MQYCQECRSAAFDGSVFCDVCGSSALAEGMPPSLLAPVSPTPHAPHAPRSASERADETAPIGAGRAPALSFPPARSLPVRSTPISAAAPSAAPGRAPRVALRMVNGVMFDLAGKSEYLIGRRDAEPRQLPDVDLADWNGREYGVSRTHAALYVQPDGVWVEDLGSFNETTRNGYRLMPGQRYPVENGDEIKVGAIALTVFVEQLDSAASSGQPPSA